jgi:hypothetical protein
MPACSLCLQACLAELAGHTPREDRSLTSVGGDEPTEVRGNRNVVTPA